MNRQSSVLIQEDLTLRIRLSARHLHLGATKSRTWAGLEEIGNKLLSPGCHRITIKEYTTLIPTLEGGVYHIPEHKKIYAKIKLSCAVF